jgi:hypothetical protein
MKNIFLILSLVVSIGFTQSSSIALRGLGVETTSIDPASIALGGSQFFSGNSKQTSISSPSSFWRSALTRISILNSYNEIEFDNQYLQKHHNFTYFGFAVPVGIKKVFSFGLSPVSRIELDINESDYSYIGADESPEEFPIATQSEYTFDGGISRFFSLLSVSLNEKLSFGLRWDFLFGTMVKDATSHNYSISYDQDGIINYNLISSDVSSSTQEFSGQNVLFELRYSQGRHEFVNSLELSAPLKVRSTPYFSNSGYAEEREFEYEMNLHKIGFGYALDLSPKSGLVFEYHSKNSVSYDEDVQIFNQNSLSEKSYNAGMFFQIVNPRLGLWNQLNLRSGTYFKQYKQYDEIFNDYGLTFGLGVEFIQNMNSIDISIELGNRESVFPEYNNEKYMKITMGLTTGEKWFVKRRRK